MLGTSCKASCPEGYTSRKNSLRNNIDEFMKCVDPDCNCPTFNTSICESCIDPQKLFIKGLDTVGNNFCIDKCPLDN